MTERDPETVTLACGLLRARAPEKQALQLQDSASEHQNQYLHACVCSQEALYRSKAVQRLVGQD